MKNTVHRNSAKKDFIDLFCTRDRFMDCEKVDGFNTIEILYRPMSGGDLAWSYTFSKDYLDSSGVPTRLEAFYFRDPKLNFWIRKRDEEWIFENAKDCPIIGVLSVNQANQFKRNFLLTKVKEDILADKKGKTKEKLKNQLEQIESMKQDAAKPKEKSCPL